MLVTANDEGGQTPGVRRTKVIRLLASAAAVLLVVPLLGLTGFIAYYKSENAPEPHPNPVLAAPPGHLPRPAAEPYTGPHPANKEWLPESFPFPIAVGSTGPVQSLNAAPPEYPFACMTEDSGLGPPLADNQQGIGVATDGGYSKDCLAPTQVQYFYRDRNSGEFLAVPAKGTVDAAEILINGEAVPYIVRVETGTINRFAYLLMALGDPSDDVEAPSSAHWNGKLVYQFRGGVGIGRRQGRIRVTRMLGRRHDVLSRGYAVAYSTANQTSNHYDVALAWDTAMRVKRQFTARYGEPEYTVGIGGSGGAIQQYLISQNYPGLLDAG
ncbi:MAG: DUF6351 family protein, partial [Pseudomonadota bacterium]